MMRIGYISAGKTHLKTGFVYRGGRAVNLTPRVIVVVARTVVSEYLDVLVAVVLLLLGEIHRGIHLISTIVQIRSQGTIVIVEGISGYRVNPLRISVIGDLDPIRRGIGHIQVLVVAARLDVAAVVKIDQVGYTLVQVGG